MPMPRQPSIFKHMSTTIGAHPASRPAAPRKFPWHLIVTLRSQRRAAPSEERQGISRKALCNAGDIMGEVPGVSSPRFFEMAAGDDTISNCARTLTSCSLPLKILPAPHR